MNETIQQPTADWQIVCNPPDSQLATDPAELRLRLIDQVAAANFASERSTIGAADGLAGRLSPDAALKERALAFQVDKFAARFFGLNVEHRTSQLKRLEHLCASDGQLLARLAWLRNGTQLNPEITAPTASHSRNWAAEIAGTFILPAFERRMHWQKLQSQMSLAGGWQTVVESLPTEVASLARLMIEGRSRTAVPQPGHDQQDAEFDPISPALVEAYRVAGTTSDGTVRSLRTEMRVAANSNDASHNFQYTTDRGSAPPVRRRVIYRQSAWRQLCDYLRFQAKPVLICVALLLLPIAGAYVVGELPRLLGLDAVPNPAIQKYCHELSQYCLPPTETQPIRLVRWHDAAVDAKRPELVKAATAFAAMTEAAAPWMGQDESLRKLQVAEINRAIRAIGSCRICCEDHQRQLSAIVHSLRSTRDRFLIGAFPSFETPQHQSRTGGSAR